MPRFQFDREKFKEAILLIASHCPTAELGNVKLHKILYFSDMLFYLHEGRPITGAEYIKQKFGPVAKHLTATVNELVADGLLACDEVEHFGVYKKNYIVKNEFSGNRLSDQEIVLVREVCDFVRGYSAKEISEISHDSAWKIVEIGETIPYHSSLQLIPSEITESDLNWAFETARAHATTSPF